MTDKAKTKLRVGIIGAGWISHAHVENYLLQDNCEVVAIADFILEKAKKLSNEYSLNANCYTDYKEMLKNENLDGVSICTTVDQHCEPTVYCLNAGVNVLLEKPLCKSLAEAKEICRAEKKSGKLLIIGFQPRFDSNMQEIKNIVQSGKLGKVYYVRIGGGRRRNIPTQFGDGFIRKATGGTGALDDIGCYALDMVLQAIGYPKPISASGYMSAYLGTNPKYCDAAERFEVSDFAAAMVRFEDDLVVDFTTSWAMHMDTTGDTLILGTDGGLRIPSTECWNDGIGGEMTWYHDVDGKQVDTVIPLKENSHNTFYSKIYHFLKAIEDGTPSPITAKEAMINQAILEAIARSAQLNREVKITLP